jgi:hypothetical protein
MSAPDYYTASSLAAAAGVGLRAFQKHLAADVGQVSKAREVVPGLGVRYEAGKCRKYLRLCLACPRRMAKAVQAGRREE